MQIYTATLLSSQCVRNVEANPQVEACEWGGSGGVMSMYNRISVVCIDTKENVRHFWMDLLSFFLCLRVEFLLKTDSWYPKFLSCFLSFLLSFFLAFFLSLFLSFLLHSADFAAFR